MGWAGRWVLFMSNILLHFMKNVCRHSFRSKRIGVVAALMTVKAMASTKWDLFTLQSCYFVFIMLIYFSFIFLFFCPICFNHVPVVFGLLFIFQFVVIAKANWCLLSSCVPNIDYLRRKFRSGKALQCAHLIGEPGQMNHYSCPRLLHQAMPLLRNWFGLQSNSLSLWEHQLPAGLRQCLSFMMSSAGSLFVESWARALRWAFTG